MSLLRAHVLRRKTQLYPLFLKLRPHLPFFPPQWVTIAFPPGVPPRGACATIVEQKQLALVRAVLFFFSELDLRFAE